MKRINIEKWNLSTDTVFKNLLSLSTDTFNLPPFDPCSVYGSINFKKNNKSKNNK